jgi:hypothetical protein
MEVTVAASIIGVIFVSLYLAFSQGFGFVQLGRENFRATQILNQQMEIFRLFSWDQLNNNPSTTNFTAPFSLVGATTVGLTYTGTVSVATPPISEGYSADLKLVTVQLDWTSGNIARQRRMRTLVSKYGLQNYLY